MNKIATYFQWISNLNRNQLSLIITFFSLSIMVLLLFNLHLDAEEQDEYVIEMSLADEDLQEILEQEEKRAEELANTNILKSNRAVNETAKPSFGNPEPLKTLEELMEEHQLNSDEKSLEEMLNENEAFANSLKEMANKREERKQQLGEKDAEKKEYTDYMKNRTTRISYSLVDRNSYELPPPIYTCLEGGKVVINITVDRLGYVTDANFNATSSNTSNGCLVENAIQYALKARFNPGDKASQLGTITYLFQSK
ncbi:energy transducer TonB [Muriicola sp. E247]|uniref:energy transducer TonB family protein n=1 Tax=Muriicola sp. E247 TaxID=3242730 RepID=UPI0035231AFD